MIDAVLVPFAASASTIVFTPWFSRREDNIRVMVELVATSQGQLKVEIFHKNRDDVGDGTLMSGNITISSVGQSSPQEWLSLMELVRFRLTASTSATPSAPGWVLYRLLAPDWFATEKA